MDAINIELAEKIYNKIDSWFNEKDRINKRFVNEDNFICRFYTTLFDACDFNECGGYSLIGTRPYFNNLIFELLFYLLKQKESDPEYYNYEIENYLSSFQSNFNNAIANEYCKKIESPSERFKFFKYIAISFGENGLGETLYYIQAFAENNTGLKAENINKMLEGNNG